MGKKKSFLISPIRGLNPKKVKVMARIARHLEKKGWKVHWPYRDTNQIDVTGGLRICQDNLKAITEADAVHVVWDGQSKGCLFDVGMAFCLGKQIIPLVLPSLTNEKSFQNIIWRYYQQRNKQEEICEDQEPWMMEMVNVTDYDDENCWDSTLLDGLEDETWGEVDEEYDEVCCDWMRQNIQDNTLYEEWFRSLSMDEDGEYHQDSNFYIRGNPVPIHHCPGCGRRIG
jgi:nucleoside 2-deoxyribosyltransferase